MKKRITAALAIMTTLISGSAISALTDRISGTREAICYNHPDKQICVDGIMAMMRGARAAAEINASCEKTPAANAKAAEICKEAKDALDWIGSN